jgi:hypothetical protein
MGLLKIIILMLLTVSCASKPNFLVRSKIVKPSKIILNIDLVDDFQKATWRSSFERLGYSVILSEEVQFKDKVSSNKHGSDIYKDVVLNDGFNYFYKISFTIDGSNKFLNLKITDLRTADIIAVYKINYTFNVLSEIEFVSRLESEFLIPQVYLK